LRIVSLAPDFIAGLIKSAKNPQSDSFRINEGHPLDDIGDQGREIGLLEQHQLAYVDIGAGKEAMDHHLRNPVKVWSSERAY
jgi:hypothetical protein